MQMDNYWERKGNIWKEPLCYDDDDVGGGLISITDTLGKADGVFVGE